MPYRYPDAWCSRNKDKPYKPHDLTKVDIVAGNGRWGFRVHPDEMTSLERRKRKYGEFNPRSRKHKPSCRRNLCHTTDKDPTIHSDIDRAIAFRGWLAKHPAPLFPEEKLVGCKQRLSRRQRRLTHGVVDS